MKESVVAVIPARSGSKSVPDKNIRPIAGKPLLAWSIEHALLCDEIERVIVDTDSPHYAEIARDFGAETPFLRPRKFAQDTSTDLDVFRHHIDWMEKNEGRSADIFVHLRPTCPYRNVDDISRMIERLRANPEADSIRSLVEAEKTPYKMWRKKEGGVIRPVAVCEVKEAFNAPRQILPKTYLQNAAIDVFRRRTITDKNSMTGDVILGYEMDFFVDIDTEEEFRQAELFLLLNTPKKEMAKKTFCIDIDGVVAHVRPDLDYEKAGPIEEGVKAVNRLYELGHRIVMFTARGTVTKLDWQKATEAQFARWGLKYHELAFGKPAADYYIDDRMLSLAAFWAIPQKNAKKG